MANGSWLMAHGSRGPRGRRPAVNHEPLTIKNQMNELFDYILLVLDIPKESYHVFRKILVPHSIFLKFSWTDLHHLSVPVFSKIVDIFGVSEIRDL